MFERRIWENMLQQVEGFIKVSFEESNEKKALLFWLTELKYHYWHNSPPLPKWCYAMDLDFLELGEKLKPKALIEIKAEETSYPQWQCDVLSDISKKLALPTYVCRFNSNLTNFVLMRISPEPSITQLLKENEMQQFLIDLRKG